MKKRKELDALLMNNMNVKKLGKSSGNGKEGHELLRNDASWDSNSTENDEFFSPPRRLTIRKPPRWRFCATGIQLCVFVVMVACIVVTGGLIWMHLDLKQDLDELRLRIAKVESALETSAEQASTVSMLQAKIEQLQTLPAQISSLNRQIGNLNATRNRLQIQLKAVQDKVDNLPTAGVEDLRKLTAQIGSEVRGVQSLQTQHTGQIDTLQTSLTDLQGDVAKLQQAASVPTPEPSHPTPDTTNPIQLLDIRKAVQSLQQEQQATSSLVTELNRTVVSLEHWKQTLMPRLVALESSSQASGPTDSAFVERVDKLQAQVNTLMSSIHSQVPNPETGNQTSSPTGSDTPTDWRHDIESEIQAIQNRLDQLNPQNLNNNLLNPNTTRGIQSQIERALSVFKEENLKSVDDLKQDNQAIWGRVYQQHSDIADLQKEVDALQVRIQDLEKKTGHPLTTLPTSDVSTTAESSTQEITSGLLQPVTIPGISTVEDTEMKFFVMDADRDEFLTYSELRDFLGLATPAKDQLMKFDKNQDDKLDLTEFKTALGFSEQ